MTPTKVMKNPLEQHDPEDVRDISAYITEDQWPIMVAILVNDDVEKLSRFSERLGLDWAGFLQSKDTKGRNRSCPPRFRSYSEEIRVSRKLIRHPYPANPFLMAIMYNAQRCCQLMRETARDVDLIAVTEFGFTAYHTLFAGLDIIRVDARSTKEFVSCGHKYLKYFVRHFFTCEDLMRMSKMRNYFYLRPLEWGIFSGYADFVDYLLYRSDTDAVQCSVSGLMEHVEMDFTSVLSTEPNRFVTILSVLAESYGESLICELQVFRKPLILAPLVDVFYSHHRIIITAMGIFNFLDTVLLVVGCDSDFRTHVATACQRAEPPPAFFLASRSLSLTVWTTIVALSFVGWRRKNQYRRSVGFPSSPRQTDRDSIAWLLPTILTILFDALLILLVGAPNRACDLLGGQSSYRPLTGTLILGQLISLICSLTTAGRLLPVLSKFINSFYRSFAMFAHFLVIYVLMLVTFSYLFKIAYRSSPAGLANDTSVSKQQPENDDFLPATYRTFLITLNVFDTETFKPSMDRADLMFTHITFILLVPIMFINFVVGVLSSVVSNTMACDIECRYLLMLSFAEYSEATYFWLFRLYELITGKRRRLVLCICRPLSRASRSMRDKNCREL